MNIMKETENNTYVWGARSGEDGRDAYFSHGRCPFCAVRMAPVHVLLPSQCHTRTVVFIMGLKLAAHSNLLLSPDNIVHAVLGYILNTCIFQSSWTM